MSSHLCQAQTLHLRKQPGWLKEFDLYTVKPESHLIYSGDWLWISTDSENLISPETEAGGALSPARPAAPGPETMWLLLPMSELCGETRCHSVLSNGKSICLEEGEKVKSGISANLFWLQRPMEVLQPPAFRSQPLGHMAKILTQCKQDAELKGKRKQKPWETQTYFVILIREAFRSEKKCPTSSFFKLWPRTTHFTF